MDDNNLNALGVQNVAEESFNTDNTEVKNEANGSFNDNSDNSTNIETEVETEVEIQESRGFDPKDLGLDPQRLCRGHVAELVRTDGALSGSGPPGRVSGG